jgi:AbrB family looped-hinge helix DNA binding protein
MADILKIGRNGELTLPRRLRASLGLREGDELVAEVNDEAIVLKKRGGRLSAYLDALRQPKRK